MNDEMLRMWRAKERLTQAQAAHLFGVTRQTIADWERGHIPGNFAERFAQAMAWRNMQKEGSIHVERNSDS